MLSASAYPLAELGLDLVRSERAWHRLARWDPRRWQRIDESLECKPTRDAHRLSALGVDWAKCCAQRSQHQTALKLTKTRPSHGRPQGAREKEREVAAPEDGRKGGGTARAGSARSAHRQAMTLVTAQRLATADLPSTRARAEQDGGGHQDIDLAGGQKP